MNINAVEVSPTQDGQLVSVIMPAYNSAKYISESIESVQNQTYQHWELIVIDDGSTDETKLIVERYQTSDCRVIYVYQQNLGVSAARNHALALAKGKYLSNLDSDDLWPQDKLEVQIKLLSKNDQLIVLGDVERFSLNPDGVVEKGLVTAVDLSDFNRRAYTLQILNLPSNKMVHFNTFCGQTKFFRRAGGWDEQLRSAEDWDFWLRLSLQVEFFHVEKIFQQYRKHLSSTTITASHCSVSLNSQLGIIEKYVEVLGFNVRIKRRLKIRAYREVIKHQIYLKHYSAAIYLYSNAMLHSNIFLTFSGIKLLMMIIKRTICAEVDKLK